MKNKALSTLFLYNGVFVFAGSLLGPLYAVYIESIDLGFLSISFTWSVFLLSSTFAMIVVRKYGDRVEEKEYLLLAGYLIRALVWFSYPFVGGLVGVLILQVLLGIGEALGTPSYDAIFAEHLDNGKHVEEYTNWKLISSILSAIAVLIGGFIVQTYGFNVLFFIMGILAIISFIGVLIKPRELL